MMTGLELICVLSREEAEKFCNTAYVNEDGEEEILGACPSYGRRGHGRISRIEIYAHNEDTKNYLINSKVPTSLFAIAYDEESDVHWYYPVEAVSSQHYIPVLEEYGHWGWLMMSPHVFEHVWGYKDKDTTDSGNDRRPLPRR